MKHFHHHVIANQLGLFDTNDLPDMIFTSPAELECCDDSGGNELWEFENQNLRENDIDKIIKEWKKY